MLHSYTQTEFISKYLQYFGIYLILKKLPTRISHPTYKYIRGIKTN